MVRRLCVYAGSNTGNDPVFVEMAHRLGSALARRDIGVVYGGGKVGLMGALADAAIAAGGEVIGVIPEQLMGPEVAHPGLSKLEVVATMHDRKARMADLSEGFIALPGGLGTLDESFEILTWIQLGLISKPIAFIDVNGYWSALFKMLDEAVDAGFLRPAHRVLAERALSPDDAIGIALAPLPPIPHKWIDRDIR
jgi:uncharacterized protein (TIGR00730 family)